MDEPHKRSAQNTIPVSDRVRIGRTWVRAGSNLNSRSAAKRALARKSERLGIQTAAKSGPPTSSPKRIFPSIGRTYPSMRQETSN